MPSPNVYDAAAAQRALRRHCPGWRWCVIDEEPVNGRFYVDHTRSEILLPGYLVGDQAMRAFLDGARELLHGAPGIELPSNVTRLRHWGDHAVPLQRGYGGAG